MASYRLHYLAAKAVINNDDCDGLLTEYGDCFLLGAQGGDLLFYAFGKFRGYGARTHDEGNFETFSRLLGYCKSNDRKDVLAYCLGYLCHYALDSALHPYVEYEAETRLPALYPEHLKGCLHMMLETRVDCAFAKAATERGEDVSLKSVLVTRKRAALSLAAVWHDVVDKIYGVDVPFSLLKKLPSRMYRYQRVFYKPRSLPCAVLRFAAKKMGYPSYIVGFFLPDGTDPDYDFLNEEHRSYPVYIDADETASFSCREIFDNAVATSSVLIRKFLRLCKEGGNLDPADFAITFSGEKARPFVPVS